MQQQMDLLKSLVEGIHKQGETAVTRAEKEKDVKVGKLTESDDIDAYLTMFEERLMKAYKVQEGRCPTSWHHNWLLKITQS
jgi:hypothetical protein